MKLLLSTTSQDLVVKRVLEFFDFPLLVELHDGGDVFVEKICELTADGEVYLQQKTSPRKIAQFMAQQITFNELLFDSSGLVVCVQRTNGKLVEKWATRRVDLPADYVPDDDARHTPSLEPDSDRVIESFLISDTWNMGWLAKTERDYGTCVDLVIATSTGEPLPDNVINRSLESGGSHALANAAMSIAARKKVERARTEGIHANSPGVLNIDSPRAYAELVRNSMQNIVDNYDKFDSLYAQIHAWSKGKPESRSPFPSNANEQLSEFSQLLHIPMKALFRSQGKDAQIRAAKLLAAHARRLKRLVQGTHGLKLVGFEDTGLMGAPADDIEY